MVTLCKRKHEMADDTLMDLVTEAFPVTVFAKQLEDKSRKIREIMECETLPDGSRQYNTLYRFRITENRLEDGKFHIDGVHEAVSPISESLQKRFVENGMPQQELDRLMESFEQTVPAESSPHAEGSAVAKTTAATDKNTLQEGGKTV